MSQGLNIRTPSGDFVNFIPNRAVAVTPSAVTVLDKGLLFVGVGGDVTCRPSKNTANVVFKNVPSGTFLPIYIIGVHTDTTATNMLICY